MKLTCGHIFCFLCIKGVAFRSRRCALCRKDVDLKYFNNPDIVHLDPKVSLDNEAHEESSEELDGYQWYYEGRNGWWQYDSSSSAEIEKSHKEGKRLCELLIAGFSYFVDFENMVQFRKTEPGRKRRIKRDVVDAEKKGVAGVRFGAQRLDNPSNRQRITSDNDRSDNVSNRQRPTSNNQRLDMFFNIQRPTPTDINLSTAGAELERMVIGSVDNDDENRNNCLVQTDNTP